MTWTERNPHPGDPPPHPGPEPAPVQPASGTFIEVMMEWWRAQQTWNTYVRRERLYAIARSVDHLVEKANRSFPEGGGLTVPENIAMILGIMFLDGSTVFSR